MEKNDNEQLNRIEQAILAINSRFDVQSQEFNDRFEAQSKEINARFDEQDKRIDEKFRVFEVRIIAIIEKAVEELALMTANGFKEVYRRLDRLELFTGIRDDMRLL